MTVFPRAGILSNESRECEQRTHTHTKKMIINQYWETFQQPSNGRHQLGVFSTHCQCYFLTITVADAETEYCRRWRNHGLRERNTSANPVQETLVPIVFTYSLKVLLKRLCDKGRLRMGHISPIHPAAPPTSHPIQLTSPLQYSLINILGQSGFVCSA